MCLWVTRVDGSVSGSDTVIVSSFFRCLGQTVWLWSSSFHRCGGSTPDRHFWVNSFISFHSLAAERRRGLTGQHTLLAGRVTELLQPRQSRQDLLCVPRDHFCMVIASSQTLLLAALHADRLLPRSSRWGAPLRQLPPKSDFLAHQWAPNTPGATERAADTSSWMLDKNKVGWR